MADYDPETDRYTLLTKYYRELDVFEYRYNPVDRKHIIEKAIVAYDKLRLHPTEPEWDRLLPKSERGQGIVLSKLDQKIKDCSLQRAGPKITVDKPNGSDAFSDKPSPQGGESMARSVSQPITTKPRKPSEKEQQSRRLLANPGKSTPSKTSARPKDKRTGEKDAGRVKSAEFVMDSDDDDNDDDKYEDNTTRSGPVRTATKPNDTKSQTTIKLTTTKKVAGSKSTAQFVSKPTKQTEGRTPGSSAAKSSKPARAETPTSTAQRSTATTGKPVKRIRDDDDTSNLPVAKKSKITNTSPHKSSPLASPPFNASMSTTSPRPRAASNTSAISARSNGSTTSTSSGRQSPATMAMVKKFKAEYEIYAKLHRALSGVPVGTPLEQGKVQKLVGLHTKLSELKEEINRAAAAVLG